MRAEHENFSQNRNPDSSSYSSRKKEELVNETVSRAFEKIGLSQFKSDSTFIKAYFNEMRQAIGKYDSGYDLLEKDFERYERILISAEEFLNDTIEFSERASSSTELFERQKKALTKRLALTRIIQDFFRSGIDRLLNNH